MQIRDEQPRDHAAIAELVERAFGQPVEARLVEKLRDDGDAAISLVAEEGDAIVGHILLSPMAAPFPALGLAPLAVLPGHERKGIGSALVKAAIARAGERNYGAVFVLGDPGYYERFGFRAALAADFSSPYAGPYFMVMPLRESLPATTGRVDYARAFDGLA
ncbi:N-acetyltransferase [Rhizobium sp. BK251]|uniref:GNAT family N-acetyltransferase n=1 Tax=Rhizobium sp. BK251 TaxID=2512125 RepID=UPI0010459BB8|nr:N-acetyltransferase [Rhizobium sp. BK251]TCL71239.1 putative acetyltransferase [Rhizobium sp. BK251]